MSDKKPLILYVEDDPDYRDMVRAHTAELERRFTAYGIDYTLLNTAHPLDHRFQGRLDRL